MTQRDLIPGAVKVAAELSHLMAITGFLYEPQLQGFCISGRVFFDRKERFKTGRLIRTSTVLEFVESNGYVAAVTYSGSVYVLVSQDGPWVLELSGGCADANGNC